MTTTEGKTPAHDASSGASSSAHGPAAARFAALLAAAVWRAPEPIDCESVAVGDMFARVLPPLFPGLRPTMGEPWEVTKHAPPFGFAPGFSRLDGPSDYTVAYDDVTLDPTRWCRVRAL